jgi:hypothetical protein
MKPTPALIDMQRCDASGKCKGHTAEDERRIGDRAEAREQQHEDQQQGDRHHDREPLRR